MDVYRYEINAPGGILVSETLGALNEFSSQEEICFISGIAPQYIRSAQLFRVTHEPGSRYLRFERADDRLVINPNFNPQSNPFRELRLRLPVVDYMDKTAGRKKLKKIVIPRPSDHVRERRQVVSDDSVEWYADLVVELPSYINSAFRSSAKNEAYLFMKDEYVLVNYAPGTTDDRIINGPLLIVDGFRSLSGTAFGEYGIDCAFDTDGTEAFIFCGEFCAYIDYAPGTTDDKILQGPHIITSLFPFFKGTVFEHGIDAAFRSSRSYEAYLFKGKYYALINYSSKTLIAIRLINQGFYGLRGTIFENGIEAAFASQRTNEAYIFKGDQYALINFAPGTTDDYIIGAGVKNIVDYWPSLKPILPRTNRGLDDTSVAN